MANITIKMNDGCSVQVSCGNRKMVKGFGIFNITEKVTCIGSTAFCRQHCYACKASQQYKNVVPQRRAANTEATRHAEFIPAMITALGKLVSRKGFSGFFRIHESGDFYDQSYVNKWAKIAAAFPDVKFLAFTKSFGLDFTVMPSNVQLVYSVMPDTNMMTVPVGPHAYAGDAQQLQGDTVIECPGLCDTCGACWGLGRQGLSVHFAIH